MNNLRLGRHHNRIHALTLLATVVASILAINSGSTKSAFAEAEIDHSPLGVINYCMRSGHTTTIYGWAYDVDAPSRATPRVQIRIGNYSQTAESNIIGYHDSKINEFIRSQRSPFKIADTYGFKASFENLPAGITYAVQGDAINVGKGSNRALDVDTSTANVDDVWGGTPFTPMKALPSTCLPASR